MKSFTLKTPVLGVIQGNRDFSLTNSTRSAIVPSRKFRACKNSCTMFAKMVSSITS